jgi:acyl phosphate:glycerol-3-phosphate acyltransferase
MTRSLFFAFFVGYLAGSVPTGLWLGLAFRRTDVRRQGSGNLGATNVFRVLGWKAGLVTLLVDIAKGFLPTWYFQTAGGNGYAALAAGLGAILGHTFSFWVRFRGGKGVATTAGVFTALLPKAMGVTAGAFLLSLAVTRVVSLSSVFASLVLILITILTTRDSALRLLGIVMPSLVIFKHRANLRRLMQGTEPRISFAKKEPV